MTGESGTMGLSGAMRRDSRRGGRERNEWSGSALEVDEAAEWPDSEGCCVRVVGRGGRGLGVGGAVLSLGSENPTKGLR